MDFYKILALLGGLCLFLFGMNIMGESLERSAGSKLRDLLAKLTTNRLAGLLTGLGVTAVIQSSSATTVMVVGFVNSGLMTLKQAINVIMGANIGTTITAWILSLTGIGDNNPILKMCKPDNFTPILAVIGIILFMFCKSDRKKDIGTILLGFATLMFGMSAMSDAVSGLKNVEGFKQMFTMFQNPILGMIAGAILTAIIQSSSASVGILQSLAATDGITLAAAIPIIMGQNIGTCVTAMLSSVGANKNARRAALVHLSFNVIGTVVWLTAFTLVKEAILNDFFTTTIASEFNIAVCHSIFNVLCVLLLLPMAGLLEKLVKKLIPDDQIPDTTEELDERLLATPPIALQRCRAVANDMAVCSVQSLKNVIQLIKNYTKDGAEEIRSLEEKSDKFEDELGSYLVKLSSKPLSVADNQESAMLLKAIGDFERISDHSVNILESIEELRDKDLAFTENAQKEIDVLTSAIEEILDKTIDAFIDNDLDACAAVEPLEQVIDGLKEELRSRHIHRLQQNDCSIEAGFIWNDLLTNFERVSDHCSNIAGGIIDIAQHTMNIHESLRIIKTSDSHFKEAYENYQTKYKLSKQ